MDEFIRKLFPVSSLKTWLKKRLNRQKALDTGMFGRMNDHCAAQMTLGFLCFFTHQVARGSPIAFDFTRARHLETLLGAGMGLHLRHKNSIFKNGAQR
jgi:hypothetical protein